MKKIAVIGVTGSIGSQAVDIIENNPELFSLSLISSHTNADALVALANRHKVPTVCFSGKNPPSKQDFDYPCELITGPNALVTAAETAEYDVFLNAVVGIDALRPTLIAMGKGARIALSNKEMLVCAGEYVMRRADELGCEIIPVDSEHSAIFQCLAAGQPSDVDSLIITSSGGAFRDVPLEELDDVLPERALEHPNWKMGKKITIDCATMVNKGFEVIEAKHLFHLSFEKIQTFLHRESIVHSMVRFKDGATIAQLSLPDMRLPIQYAFTYPDRIPSQVKPLDVPFSLTFERIDPRRYPCFTILLEAGKKGGLYPAAMLAADSVLVPAYLEGSIKYSTIPGVLERVLGKFSLAGEYDLSDVLRINDEVEKYTRSVVKKI